MLLILEIRVSQNVEDSGTPVKELEHDYEKVVFLQICALSKRFLSSSYFFV